MPPPISNVLSPGQTGQIDLGAAGARIVCSAVGVDEWAWQVALKPGSVWPTGATAVVTAKYSQDGINFVAAGTPETMSAVGILPVPGSSPNSINVTPYRLVALEVTTAGGSSVLADVTGFGQKD